METDAKAFKKLFPQGHIPSVLDAIFQAGKSLQKKTEQDMEDWITRRLYNRLRHRTPFRDGPLDITLKKEIISSDLDANTAAGEIDISISCGIGNEVYFPFEAKRLRFCSFNGRVTAGSAAYVNDGMMSFISGQYAPYMEAAAMLGYVFDGKTDIARAGIDRAVKTKAMKLKLRAPKQLLRSHILPGSPVDETHHDLKNRFFTIYHIFLAV
ncbi:MAG: hypothetical protein HY730_08165 [Candidatus Tectomicrobia bacterium]|uniref:Uncharacterized protein n=1 Tax=Tectimicrobiota bacterium TaxID=2528274 RepID=A0A933GN06_UNCTE|nr:hypothetical protein [Candidatus Tectomicrobia bacterium]